jgi:hypothetical protein
VIQQLKRSLETYLFKLRAALICIALAGCAAQPSVVAPPASAPTASANNVPASPPVPPKQEYVDALLPYEPLQRCLPTQHQLKLADLAATVIETADDNSQSMKIGAEQYLSLQPCLGPDTLRRVQVAWESNEKAFRKGRLVDYQLHLASRLPNPNDDIVRAIADSAFNAQPQSSQFLARWDIRPLARAILARHFGSRIREYGQRAYDEISSANSMGTGAAQVAAAAGYPGALPRIASVMDQIMAQYPQGGTTMPSERYKRLIELLWSFEVAGPAARDYLAKYCEAVDRYWWRGAANAPMCVAGGWQLYREPIGDKEGFRQ